MAWEDMEIFLKRNAKESKMDIWYVKPFRIDFIFLVNFE